jgi:hypothetical protein
MTTTHDGPLNRCPQKNGAASGREAAPSIANHAFKLFGLRRIGFDDRRVDADHEVRLGTKSFNFILEGLALLLLRKRLADARRVGGLAPVEKADHVEAELRADRFVRDVRGVLESECRVGERCGETLA